MYVCVSYVFISNNIVNIPYTLWKATEQQTQFKNSQLRIFHRRRIVHPTRSEVSSGAASGASLQPLALGGRASPLVPSTREARGNGLRMGDTIYG